MTKFTPANRQGWRAWLERNHADATEVWLVFLKKHTRRPNLSYDDAVEEALCFGWIDGIRRSLDEDRYVHRFTPRKAYSNWSESNRKRVEHLLATGQMTEAGLRVIEAAKQNGQWNELTVSGREVSMPHELRDELKRHKAAKAFFADLAPSYQRQYVAWIAAAKKPATRKRRVSEAIDLLNRGEKLGMR